MKKRLTALLCTALLLCAGAAPAWAESADSSDVSGEKAAVSQETNPNTGAVTLGTVSVALAGCAVLVCKKRK
ncbi:NPXTG-anchored protein [Ruminococcus sp.]|uniref:NPXTG-anchored protein n=1 Tax=Ruminococcus sp. TaxID=41978 RepID=UPI0025F036A6|nr:NPXTG-anchored protein [Ruminococcus sp.]MBQ8966556.1 NPXTG-anchored protein [Ruminococcus sp.]